MQKHSVTLVSTLEPDLCSSDPSRKLVRQVLGAISEYVKSMIVLKPKGERQRMKAKTGRCEGSKPYGSHLKHPRELKTLERIQAMPAEGRSYSRVASALNLEGIKPRSGKVWCPFAVQRIVNRQVAV